MKSVARAMGKSVDTLTVMVQDRPRHQGIIQQVIDLGAKVVLFSDGDVTAAIATAIETIAVEFLSELAELQKV